ncbi:MlaC/ttg2D family ABC transporter substrate-binding protein [Tropicimonas sp. S265A]|uniref:MlaC/ttg2D family ABC transporter substrate-binding protein n=1 Tax=Tropicimonas sp. S265A TaxID=3415134 RepID=UPI003C7BBB86
MPNNLSRRSALSLMAAAGAALGLSGPSFALTSQGASSLVTKLVDDIQRTVNSGKTGPSLYREFERIFKTYADLPIIAQSVMGVEWRTASASQRRAFTEAFAGYVSRKYGKQFRDFIGGRVEVKSARPIRTFYEVRSTAYLKGESPFDVVFLVSDRSGSDRVFNIIVEGVNMNTSERTEIGAMIDRRRGDIDAMIADLRQAG